MAPTRLLPEFLQGAAQILPFRYMVAFPVEVLAGHLGPAEVRAGFAIGTGWLLVALVLSAALWRAGLRRYSAVGG